MLSLADAIPTGRAVVSCAPQTRFLVTTLSLAERIVAINTALSAIPAVRWALALAYYAELARSTSTSTCSCRGPVPAVAAPLVARCEADDPSVAKQIQRAGQAM